VGIEIAALSALAAISAQMGKKVYFPFGIVTLIQFIGNIFFAYQYIDVNSQSFKDWVDLVDPLVSFMGVESGDVVGHKRFLALFAGGMLPIISLSFLHMLVKFEEEDKKKSSSDTPVDLSDPEVIEKISTEAGKMEADLDKEKYTPTPEDIERLEEELKKLNERKFGNLVEEESVDQNIENEVEEKEVMMGFPPQIKRLSYSRRNG
jgi:spermidine/putrescine-binding protein